MRGWAEHRFVHYGQGADHLGPFGREAEAIENGRAEQVEGDRGNRVDDHRSEGVPAKHLEPASGAGRPFLGTVVGADEFRVAFFEAPVGIKDEFTGGDADDAEGRQRGGDGKHILRPGRKLETEAGHQLPGGDRIGGIHLEQDDVEQGHQREARDHEGREVLNEAIAPPDEQKRGDDRDDSRPDQMVVGARFETLDLAGLGRGVGDLETVVEAQFSLDRGDARGVAWDDVEARAGNQIGILLLLVQFDD